MGVLVDKWPDDSAASNIGRFAGGRRRANLRQADGHVVPIEMALTQTSSDSRPLTVISLHEITGQYLQEQYARSHDTRLDDFSAAAASWFWESDAELRFSYISANFLSITGRDPKSLIGALQTDIIRGMADQDAFERHVEDLRNHRPFRNFECDYRHANGEIGRVHVNGQPILDTDGTFLGYRGTCADTTDRRRTIDRMVRVELLLRDAVESMTDGFAVFNSEERLVLCNQNYAQLYGEYFPGRLVGVKFEDLLRRLHTLGIFDDHLARTDPEASKAERLARHRDPPEEPTERQLSDGRWLLVRKRRTREGGIVGVYSDITAVKHAEALLRDGVEAIVEGFALWGQDDRLILCNDALRNVLADVAHLLEPGVTFEDIVRACAYRGVYVQAIGREEEWIAERMARHRNPSNQLELTTATGRCIRFVESRTATGCYVTTLLELTELKQREQALKMAKDQAEAANRVKSQFLANMSHELRTPLNAILGFSEILRDEMFGALGSQSYVDYAADIHGSGQHLLSLINDILDMSKIEAGRYELKRVRVTPNSVVDAVIRMMEGQAADAHIGIVTDVPEDLPTIHADERALHQILINLLSNAIKFTPAQGRVTIGARAQKDELVIAISDTGVGIRADQISRLAQPFEQADSALASSHKGTGLGLAVTKALAELHGGSLTIDSRPGAGTTVTVKLPR